MKKQDVEIINIEIQSLKNSITWWQSRFNAVERNNRDLKVEIERLNNIINRIESICSSLEFSAPENTYIFIEQLREIIEENK